MPKLYDNKVDVAKKPGWLKIRLHRTTQFAEVDRIVREHALHTICSSGMCPNKAECWSRRTATFMILGDVLHSSGGHSNPQQRQQWDAEEHWDLTDARSLPVPKLQTGCRSAKLS